MFTRFLTTLILIIATLALFLTQIPQETSAQIYRQNGRGFDIDVGPFFRMNYDRNRGPNIDLQALSGLVNFDYARNLGRGGRRIGVDAFGLGRQGTQRR